jgi:iron-sulfur cluster insertion protein
MNEIASVETISPTAPQLFLTDCAAIKLYALLTEEDLSNGISAQQGDQNPHSKLRIFIEGGGCSGFKYEFAFEAGAREDDYVLKKTVQIEDRPYEIQVVVDPMSFLYLQNAQVDYQEDFQQSEFKIRNPNAQTTCGCGSSFSA